MAPRRRTWPAAITLLLLPLACDPESPVVGTDPSELDEGGGASGTGGSLTGGSPIDDSGDRPGAYRVSTSILSIDDVESGDPFCIYRLLPDDSDGSLNCSWVHGSFSDGACDCEGLGRRPVDDGLAQTIVQNELTTGDWGFCDGEGLPPCESLCLCEAVEAQGAAVDVCQTSADASETNAWCLLDSDPELECGKYGRRIRMLGGAAPNTGEITFLTCWSDDRPVGPALELGAPCIPSKELDVGFAGFDEDEVAVEFDHSGCESGVCLANHFRGRVTCPYGQSHASAVEEDEEFTCWLPYSNQPVVVPVRAQLEDRPASLATTCSCRCDGPGPGPFCECPDDMECAPVVPAVGIDEDSAHAGSYCIPRSAQFDPFADLLISCDSDTASCGDDRPYPPQ